MPLTMLFMETRQVCITFPFFERVDQVCLEVERCCTLEKKIIRKSRNGGGGRYLWLSALIKTTSVWLVPLYTSGQQPSVNEAGAWEVRVSTGRVVEGSGWGSPFNCNHFGNTAGIYMPCIQLEGSRDSMLLMDYSSASLSRLKLPDEHKNIHWRTFKWIFNALLFAKAIQIAPLCELAGSSVLISVYMFACTLPVCCWG